MGSGSTFGPRDINKEIVMKIVPVRAVDLSIGPFCTEFWCERFCDEGVFRDRGQLSDSFSLKVGLAKIRSVKSCQNIDRKLGRDMNTGIVAKMVPVRAVDLSIGPFCTEFRCECFCDDAAFGIGVNFFGPET